MNGSTPMSTRRVIADTALLVCRVVSTRWPVREARTASPAVSLSRISPEQDDVGVLAQHGTQPAAEGQPAALVHLDLGDPGHLHLDRVLERRRCCARASGCRRGRSRACWSCRRRSGR